MGIISLNSFEISHIGINRYDDCGNMIEEASGGMSSTMSRCGREGFSSWITENSNRGYATLNRPMPDISTNAVLP